MNFEKLNNLKDDIIWYYPYIFLPFKSYFKLRLFIFQYRHAVYVMTCKLFADIERLKVRESEKQAQEKYDIIRNMFCI